MDKELRNKIVQFGERARQSWAEESIVSLTPARTDNYHSFLAGYAAVLEDEYGDLEVMKPVFMSKLPEGTSEAERLRKWGASPEGQRHAKLKSTLKGIDRIIAACKKRMDRFNNEAFNKY